MKAAIVLFIGTIIVWLVTQYFRGIKIFNIANSIILAAITYEQMPNNKKLEADKQLSELLDSNPKLRETLPSLNEPGRELVKWRWYSISFAYNQILPAHSRSLGWARSKNVYQDVILVGKGIPDIKDHLNNRELFSKHLRWLEISDAKKH